MTLRERLANGVTELRLMVADCISGGLLGEALDLTSKATDDLVRKHNLAAERYAALQAIIACETPSANATVKRMAKIAREAVE